MPVFQHAPVDAHLIHKEHLDDVLVSNFRGELPTRLSEDILADDSLDAEQRALIERHYMRLGEIEGLCCAQDGLLVRRSVPVTLPKSVADEEGFAFIRHYYKETSTQLVLQAKYIREDHEVRLMNRLVPGEDQISAYDRHRLSAVTDTLRCNEKPSRYYMNMINDLENYFFYRKHHEHVPGIMLVEVARQAVYAQYYRTSPHNRGEVTLTIKSLNCDFEGYVDSNYPVTVCVETTDDETEVRETGFERRTTTFYQNGKLMATVEIVGLPIKMKIFKRLRMVKPDPQHWFVPVKNFARSAIFTDGSGKRIEGRLNRISRCGMEITFDRHIDDAEQLDFVLSVEGIGYVDGKVKVEEVREDGKAIAGRVSFAEISLDAERKWYEAIKNFSHVESRSGAY